MIRSISLCCFETGSCLNCLFVVVQSKSLRILVKCYTHNLKIITIIFQCSVFQCCCSKFMRSQLPWRLYLATSTHSPLASEKWSNKSEMEWHVKRKTSHDHWRTSCPGSADPSMGRGLAKKAWLNHRASFSHTVH